MAAPGDDEETATGSTSGGGVMVDEAIEKVHDLIQRSGKTENTKLINDGGIVFAS